MPTNTNAYNSRVTDEALEKRFRDTFRAQGGAELVDDLYAQGVIVPIVDFTAAATGQQLSQNLQTAWDFSTGEAQQVGTGQTTAITTAGFWQVHITANVDFSGTNPNKANVIINDGSSGKSIWNVNDRISSHNEEFIVNDQIIVFLRSSDSLVINADANASIFVHYRQIATVSGDLVNPTGFTSS